MIKKSNILIFCVCFVVAAGFSLWRPQTIAEKSSARDKLAISCANYDGEWKRFSHGSNCEWVVVVSSRDFISNQYAETNWCAMKSGKFLVIPGKEDSSGNYIESIDACTFKDEE